MGSSMAPIFLSRGIGDLRPRALATSTVSMKTAGVVVAQYSRKGKNCTVNAATGGYDGLMIVACESDAED